MVEFMATLKKFFNDRWFVFVAAMWIQSVAGVGYLFGSISPAIKSSLNYNQKQLARLGVAKDLGDSVGFHAGYLCEILPLWAALLIGAMQNFIGYGWVWLIVTHRAPALPLWVMCILIFVGTNGECYFNTAALVSCVQNFPKSRGPIVGILKGFAGLSGAILTQIYALVNSPDNSPIIFMVAVGPTMVVIALMFIVRPVGGHKQVRPSDGKSFAFVYSVCVLLAAYLMGVMIVEDIVDLKYNVIISFTAFLFVLLLLPIVIPILSFSSDRRSPLSDNRMPEEEGLLPENTSLERSVSSDAILSELEDEKPRDVDLLPAVERKKRMAQLQAKLLNAAAEGAVRIRQRPLRPHRGENFTLTEALVKADLWLIFFSLLLGSGSGVTVIDNLGQMSQSLGYDNTHIFVSMISIWNFLGRIGGGYLSEVVVKDYIYPRPVALAMAQVIMAVGHMFFAMGWSMHVGTMLIGLGYGAHWAVVPATLSELFGLKNFGALYNFITIAMPAGSLVFSGVIASSIYDYEAEKQAHMHQNVTANTSSILMRMLDSALGTDEPHKCDGSICYFVTSLIMSGFCIVAVVLSLILVRRTKIVYTNLYGRTGSSLSLL